MDTLRKHSLLQFLVQSSPSTPTPQTSFEDDIVSEIDDEIDAAEIRKEESFRKEKYKEDFFKAKEVDINMDINSDEDDTKSLNSMQSLGSMQTQVSKNQYSVYSYERDQTPEWKSGLKKFERFRIINGHTIESLFNLIDRRNTKSLPIKEFADNLTEIDEEITFAEAISFCIRADKKKDKNIKLVTLKDITDIIKLEGKNLTLEGLLQNHSIFPEWLTKRNDFQKYYDIGHADGVSSMIIIEQTLKLDQDQRREQDLQVLCKWLKLKKILVHVLPKRLLLICRRTVYLECPIGTIICKQGDPGDAFYVLLSGSLEVVINGEVINIMGPGTSFGEKALENDTPRSATVRALTASKLMMVLASEYKTIVKSAQSKNNSDIAQFLCDECPILRQYSYPRMYQMVKNMLQRSFKPGEKILKQGAKSSMLCIIKSGKVELIRRLHRDKLIPKHLQTTLILGPDGISPIKKHKKERRKSTLLNPTMSSLLHNHLLGLHPHLNNKKNSNNNNNNNNNNKNKIVIHPSIMNGFGINNACHLSEELHVPGISQDLPSPVVKSKVETNNPAVALKVLIKTLQQGEIFGEDCLRREIPMGGHNYYSALAVGNVELVLINKRDVFEYLKTETCHDIMRNTIDHHIEEAELLKKYDIENHKNSIMENLKQTALGPIYEKQDLTNPIYTRNISTKTLEEMESKKINSTYAFGPAGLLNMHIAPSLIHAVQKSIAKEDIIHEKFLKNKWSNYYETEMIRNENRTLNALKKDKISEFVSPVYTSFPVSPIKKRLNPITRGNGKSFEKEEDDFGYNNLTGWGQQQFFL